MQTSSEYNKIEYKTIDLSVVLMANVINILMTFLFIFRISHLNQLEHGFGIITIIMGFILGIIAIYNKYNGREKWEVLLLLPVFIFFVVELILDYILVVNFRETAFVGLYILLYYVGLWGLIGYAFRFEKKWGFITLITYFFNMTFSILPYILIIS